MCLMTVTVFFAHFAHFPDPNAGLRSPGRALAGRPDVAVGGNRMDVIRLF